VTEPEPVDADQEPAALIVAGICAKEVPKKRSKTIMKVAACFKHDFELSMK
jgi:hypothetical protein